MPVDRLAGLRSQLRHRAFVHLKAVRQRLADTFRAWPRVRGGSFRTGPRAPSRSFPPALERPLWPWRRVASRSAPPCPTRSPRPSRSSCWPPRSRRPCCVPAGSRRWRWRLPPPWRCCSPACSRGARLVRRRAPWGRPSASSPRCWSSRRCATARASSKPRVAGWRAGPPAGRRRCWGWCSWWRPPPRRSSAWTPRCSCSPRWSSPPPRGPACAPVPTSTPACTWRTPRRC